ncbi:MAG: CbtA family protein [Chloroflexi bacterium]|nr:CbtA family protein [Chloroflexota bacterium]
MTAWLLAAAVFVTVVLVPFLKYPANPPAVGDPATINRRTALYWGMTLISILAAIAALRFRRYLATVMSRRGALLAAIGAYSIVVLAVGLVMPGVYEVPATFPAVTLWKFREASIAIQFTMWTTIGLVFGALVQRRLREGAPERGHTAARSAGG